MKGDQEMSDLIRIGTYNTNNLFDRFNDPYNYSDDPWQRVFASKPKKLQELYHLGRRISTSRMDILALQEVESLGALREFVSGHVGPGYPLNGVISFESNDPRGIDLGVISQFPLGRIISHRFRRHNGRPVFSRDCLQVEILKSDKKTVMLTLFICHLKSKYSPHKIGTAEWKDDQKNSASKRQRQVTHTIEIIQNALDIQKDPFIILGDLNDTPESSALQGFLKSDNVLQLKEAISTISQPDTTPNSTTKRPRDTHKWTKDPDKGHPETTYSQLDYILLSPAVVKAFPGTAKVEHHRYTTGSDHYLCWAEIDAHVLS
jgi:endonuclease/exonuclease/phosphatase family metal-dependent hydrolase